MDETNAAFEYKEKEAEKKEAECIRLEKFAKKEKESLSENITFEDKEIVKENINQVNTAKP